MSWTADEQAEFRLIRQRIQLVVRAIALLTLSILLISAVVAVIFLTVALQINLSVVVAPLFVAAMLMLTSAAFCFLAGNHARIKAIAGHLRAQ